MDYNIPVPKQSRLAFWAIKDKSIQHAGLVFERFAPDTKDDSKLKEDGLQAVLKAYGDSRKPNEGKEKLFKAWNARWEGVVRAAGAEPFTLKTDWRLIAGLGKKGSLEVGFTFHRYGFPYLPGSSLKGLARAYGLLEIALGLESAIKNKNQKEPLSKLDEILSCEDAERFEEDIRTYQPKDDLLQVAKAFRLVFGTTDTAGKVVFFDAIPSEIPKLEMDIMNPHYPDYYKEGSKEYPTNWQNPIPVKFLTVASGSAFRFAIGWRGAPEDGKPDAEKKQTKFSWWKGDQIEKIKGQAPDDHPRMLKLARRWLQGGLLELGAGAKTSAGYGYFLETKQ